MSGYSHCYSTKIKSGLWRETKFSKLIITFILECPDTAMDDKKAKIGRKLSRVLSIFRKKSTEEAIKSGLEPVYEELIYSNGSTDIRLRF